MSGFAFAPESFREYLLDLLTGDPLGTDAWLEAHMTHDFIHRHDGRTMTRDRFAEYIRDFRTVFRDTDITISSLVQQQGQLCASYFMQTAGPGWPGQPANIVRQEVMAMIAFEPQSRRIYRWNAMTRELKVGEHVWQPPSRAPCT